MSDQNRFPCQPGSNQQQYPDCSWRASIGRLHNAVHHLVKGAIATNGNNSATAHGYGGTSQLNRMTASLGHFAGVGHARRIKEMAYFVQPGHPKS